MQNNNIPVSAAEKNATCVSYEVMGTKVELDLNFVKRYLVRGQADKVSDQEVVFFINTCKAQKLNPLVAGDCYLIKFGNDPAQMVVGKDAYLRRAFDNPNYLSKKEGITVKLGDEIVQKEGCCLYPGEELLGGWCRVLSMRQGKESETFKEVSLAEYNKGQASWKVRPATMIVKVAVSQCVRDAFPKDYSGLYSEDEMVAAGAIPPMLPEEASKNPAALPKPADNDPVITQGQRQALFKAAKNHLGAEANDVVLTILQKYGHRSTSSVRVSEYAKIMADLNGIIDARKAEQQSQPETPAGEAAQAQTARGGAVDTETGEVLQMSEEEEEAILMGEK